MNISSPKCTAQTTCRFVANHANWTRPAPGGEAMVLTAFKFLDESFDLWRATMWIKDKCLGMIDKHETTHMFYSNHWSIVGKDYTKCLQDVVLKSTMPAAKKTTNTIFRRGYSEHIAYTSSILQPSIAYICIYGPAQTLQHCDSW